MRIRNFITYIILALLISISAKSESSRGEIFIANFTKTIFNIISDKEASHDKILISLTSEIKKNIDLEYICNFVIGRKWNSASPEFQQRFMKLYESYIIGLYAPQFQGYNGESYKIIKTEEVRTNRFSSQLVFILQNKTQLNITIYFIRYKNNEFKIVDVTGEGISLLASQREEFSSIINMYGLDYFIEAFQEKVKQNQ